MAQAHGTKLKVLSANDEGPIHEGLTWSSWISSRIEHDHSRTTYVGAMVGPAYAPRPIRRAEQLIVRHAREPLTVRDIAEAVGLSVRGLQAGFRRYFGTTPLARLREARLAGAHAELIAADPTTTTVSAVAASWGFWHLGRFSGAYRQRWGVPPSVTLRS